MSELEIFYILAVAAAAVFTIVAVVGLLFPMLILRVLKRRRKHIAQLQALQQMEKQEGPITTWEFEKRCEEVLLRIKERLLLAVRYQLTVGDYIRFLRYYYWRSRTYLLTRLLIWLGWVVAAALLGLYGLFVGNWNPNLVRVIFGAGAAWLFVYPPLAWLAVVSVIRDLARKRSLIGTVGVKHLIITPDSLIDVNTLMTSEIPWRNVPQFIDAGDYTFIFLTPISAVVLPKQGFSSLEEYEQVKALAKERFNGSRQTKEEPPSLPAEVTAKLPTGPSEKIQT